MLNRTGGYYLYTSGGNAPAARRKAEADARVVREKTLDGAERIGDKIDRAYDDAKDKIEKGYKSSKAEIEREITKERKEIGKQVEVCPPEQPSPSAPGRDDAASAGSRRTWDTGFAGRWGSAFGGFAGLGLSIRC